MPDDKKKRRSPVDTLTKTLIWALVAGTLFFTIWIYLDTYGL